MLLLDNCFTLADADSLFKIINSVVSTAAIIIGGFWVYYKFISQGENNVKVDMTLCVEFHHKTEKYWIAELIAYVENKGKVQHKITSFEFQLWSLNSTDSVET